MSGRARAVTIRLPRSGAARYARIRSAAGSAGPCAAFWIPAGGRVPCLNPPPGTVLISVDENNGIQANSRRHPGIPGWPGRDAPPGWARPKLGAA